MRMRKREKEREIDRETLSDNENEKERKGKREREREGENNRHKERERQRELFLKITVLNRQINYFNRYYPSIDLIEPSRNRTFKIILDIGSHFLKSKNEEDVLLSSL